MLSLNEIKRFYPASIHFAGGFLIREYLHYKILEAIYESDYAGSLVFMGGTCLRLIHGNNRFSEDLDFDNLKLNENEFAGIPQIIRQKMEREGYEIEIRSIHRKAFHCYIRFPRILFGEGLSGHREQKLLIQLDSETQGYAYQPEKYILNKFDVFTEIHITPIKTLLAQKLYAVLNRNKNKGRDFYDIVFLLSIQKEPDWEYLDKKVNIQDPSGLKKALIEHCETINLEEMARDVEPFLFDAKEIKKVLQFPDMIRQMF